MTGILRSVIFGVLCGGLYGFAAFSFCDYIGTKLLLPTSLVGVVATCIAFLYHDSTGLKTHMADLRAALPEDSEVFRTLSEEAARAWSAGRIAPTRNIQLRSPTTIAVALAMLSCAALVNIAAPDLPPVAQAAVNAVVAVSVGCLTAALVPGRADGRIARGRVTVAAAGGVLVTLLLGAYLTWGSEVLSTIEGDHASGLGP